MGTDPQPQSSPAPQRPSTPAFQIPCPSRMPHPPTPHAVHVGGFGVGMAPCFSVETRGAPALGPSIPTPMDSSPRHVTSTPNCQPSISIPCRGSATTILLHLCPSCACPPSIPCHQPAPFIPCHRSGTSMFCHRGPLPSLLHPLPPVSFPMAVPPPSHVTKQAFPLPAMKAPSPSRLTRMASLSPCHGGATSVREVAPPSPHHGSCSPWPHHACVTSLSGGMSSGVRALGGWAWPSRVPQRRRCPARTTRTGAVQWSMSPSRLVTTTSTSPSAATPSLVRGDTGTGGGGGVLIVICWSQGFTVVMPPMVAPQPSCPLPVLSPWPWLRYRHGHTD